MEIYFVYNKLTQENTINFVNRLLTETKKKGIIIKLIQSDNGHEFQAKFEEYLKTLSIKIQHTWIHNLIKMELLKEAIELMRKNSTKKLK